MAPRNRHKRGFYLVGGEECELRGSRLPSKRQVLSFFLHQHMTENKTIRDSATIAIRETPKFWERARIPYRDERNTIPRLEEYHQRWRPLKKCEHRRSSGQIANEEKFKSDLDQIFDIAPPQVLSMIKEAEDREFYIAQKEKGRKGSMVGVDKITAAVEQRSAARKEAAQKRAEKQKKEQEVFGETVTMRSESDDYDTSDAGFEPEEPSCSHQGPDTAPTSKLKKKGLLREHAGRLTSALDRINTSDREATFVVNESLMSCGIDVKKVGTSRSSIRRMRIKEREEIAKTTKKGLQLDAPLVVHWDGKLLPSPCGRGKAERLPVVVSGPRGEHLIGVATVERGTGMLQAKAVAEHLQDWKLTEKVCGMCFDTTSSNTGNKSGACVLLENILNKPLLNLACRHHIREIVLAAVFHETVARTTGPDYPLFKRFKDAWDKIDVTQYESGIMDPNVFEAIKEDMFTVIDFCLKQLEVVQPREDYRELLELTVVFLGGVPPRGIKFHAPGALHTARWMAKGIYSLKMWMFRSQGGHFQLTTQEKNSLSEVCKFIALVYIRDWYTAPLAVSAPRNDILFLQALSRFSEINPTISTTALNKFSNHLWYLGEVLIGFAFFDDGVHPDTLVEMSKAIRDTEEDGDDPPKRLVLSDTVNVEELRLQDLVSTKTTRFFDCLGVKTDFLHAHQKEWTQNKDYTEAKQIVSGMKLVNDIAERGVALITEYCNSLTKDSEQQGYLLQVVQNHRKKFPNCNLASIVPE